MSRLLAALVLLFLALPAWADKAEVLGKDGLPVYSSPSGKKRLGQLPPQTKVDVVEDRGGAARVRGRGLEGWVKRSRLQMLEEPKAPAAPPVPAPVPVSAPPAVPPATTGGSPPPVAPALPPAAPAKDPGTDGGYLAKFDKEEGAAKVDVGPSVFTAVSALLLVLALVAGAVYLIRLLSGRRALGGAKTKGIQVLATRPLGPRQALLLVEVGGVPLLLAQGEGMVNLIAEIRDPEAVRRLNDLYGFRETPFEAELRGRLDLEAAEEDTEVRARPPRSPRAEAGPVPEEPGPSVEDRLAALRRRPKLGGEP
ncbi:MAG: flagellar biosynthetic protein FliO [Deltaproteobacteria bacterium]|nr:flagellar biosynthetic protein FliO [Deltaproteobacteria bacterium]